MPELPEVETLLRQLRQTITSEKICEVRIYDEKLVRFPEMIGRRVREIRRAGKEVEIDLGGPVIHIHLRMSGRLFWRRSGDLIPPHTRFSIAFENGEIICIDPRRFATLTFRSGPSVLRSRPVDILTGMDPREICNRAGRRRLPVKALLL
ncbi:MAG TPA: DNA-formamidopyrimidine glycosylase family protein, partial [Syntrophales bacterium]|nr:DNA-formamidopyrimidine glycosylase family protein [Syntrophales bacterium]HQG35273.1 DNA-formamidopyrimidine glycosylase family protein [Syntrophales bacterium]HQJ31305.1 DNA-formamidopyrimidine glycosylase family protein [Syntrophales bacterium]